MTISLDLPKQILNAQTEAQKPENIKSEDTGGMLIENAKFPKAIRTKVWNHVRMGTICLKAGAVYLVMAICGREHARRSLQNALVTNMDMSTAYHPQQTGKSERTIQNSLKDIFGLEIDFGNEAQYSSRTDSRDTEKIISDQAEDASRSCRLEDLRRCLSEITNGIPSRLKSHAIIITFVKCHADEPLAVPLDGLHLDDKLHFVEEP
ncbi:hypothetical protein Tco_0111977 [Tanacetum coccineum]